MMRHIIRLVLPVAVLAIITGMLPVLPTDIGGRNQFALLSDSISPTTGVGALNSGGSFIQERQDALRANAGTGVLNYDSGASAGVMSALPSPDPVYYQIAIPVPSVPSQTQSEPTTGGVSAPTPVTQPVQSPVSSGGTTSGAAGVFNTQSAPTVVPGAITVQSPKISESGIGSASQLWQQPKQTTVSPTIDFYQTEQGAAILSDIANNPVAGGALLAAEGPCEVAYEKAKNSCEILYNGAPDPAGESHAKNPTLYTKCLGEALGDYNACKKNSPSSSASGATGASGSAAGQSAADLKSTTVYIDPTRTKVIELKADTALSNTASGGGLKTIAPQSFFIPSNATVSTRQCAGCVPVQVTNAQITGGELIELVQSSRGSQSSVGVQVTTADDLLNAIATKTAQGVTGQVTIQTSGGEVVIPKATTGALQVLGSGVVKTVAGFEDSVTSVFGNIGDFFGALTSSGDLLDSIRRCGELSTGDQNSAGSAGVKQCGGICDDAGTVCGVDDSGACACVSTLSSSPTTGQTCPSAPKEHEISFEKDGSDSAEVTITRQKGEGECVNAKTTCTDTTVGAMSGNYSYTVSSCETVCENEQKSPESKRDFQDRAYKAMQQLEIDLSGSACKNAKAAVVSAAKEEKTECDAECPNDGVETNCAACGIKGEIDPGECGDFQSGDANGVTFSPNVKSVTIKVTMSATAEGELTWQAKCGLSGGITVAKSDDEGDGEGDGGNGGGGGGGGGAARGDTLETDIALNPTLLRKLTAVPAIIAAYVQQNIFGALFGFAVPGDDSSAQVDTCKNASVTGSYNGYGASEVFSGASTHGGRAAAMANALAICTASVQADADAAVKSCDTKCSGANPGLACPANPDKPNVPECKLTESGNGQKVNPATGKVEWFYRAVYVANKTEQLSCNCGAGGGGSAGTGSSGGSASSGGAPAGGGTTPKPDAPSPDDEDDDSIPTVPKPEAPKPPAPPVVTPPTVSTPAPVTPPVPTKPAPKPSEPVSPSGATPLKPDIACAPVVSSLNSTAHAIFPSPVYNFLAEIFGAQNIDQPIQKCVENGFCKNGNACTPTDSCSCGEKPVVTSPETPTQTPAEKLCETYSAANNEARNAVADNTNTCSSDPFSHCAPPDPDASTRKAFCEGLVCSAGAPTCHLNKAGDGCSCDPQDVYKEPIAEPKPGASSVGSGSQPPPPVKPPEPPQASSPELVCKTPKYRIIAYARLNGACSGCNSLLQSDSVDKYGRPVVVNDHKGGQLNAKLANTNAGGDGRIESGSNGFVTIHDTDDRSPSSMPQNPDVRGSAEYQTCSMLPFVLIYRTDYNQDSTCSVKSTSFKFLCRAGSQDGVIDALRQPTGWSPTSAANASSDR